MSGPTPADLAAADQKRQASEAPEAIFDSINSRYPGIVSLLGDCGISVMSELIKWLAAESPTSVRSWVDETTSPQLIVGAWKKHLSGNAKPGLLAALIKEAHLSKRPGEIGPNFKGFNLTYANSVRQSRLDVGFEFMSTARDAQFEDGPIFYVRRLDFAALYLGHVTFGDRLDHRDLNPGVLGRYGVAVVLRGRFKRAEVPALRSACGAIEESIALGNIDKAAYEYFVEGLTQLYDATGERAALSRAGVFVRQQGDGPGTALWHMNAAEVWLKLIELSTPSARSAFVRLAGEHLAKAAKAVDFVHSRGVRLRMLSALHGSVENDVSLGVQIECRGFSFPFGLRTSARLPLSVERSISALLAALHSDDYLSREISAGLRSYRARRTPTPFTSLADLETSVQLREGQSRSNPIHGELVELAQAEDLLLIARLRDDERRRHRALNLLLAHVVQWPSSAAALAAIAQNLEDLGPLNTDESFPAASGRPSPRMAALIDAIRTGSATAVYSLAAAAAESSLQSGRRGLGGRSQVVAVDDASGAGQTFVFKPMSRASLEFERAQSRAIAKKIREMRVEHRFGVVDQLAVVEVKSLRIPIDERYDVIGVQKYVDSDSLLDLTSNAGRDALPVLKATAEFLALIHTIDSRVETPDGCRKQTKERDVRYWLRRIVSDDAVANALFDEWWSIVGGAGRFFKRRDAHVQNWLVDRDGRILAVDLDCNGWRPLGYELAQLTDDHPVLDADDWEARKQVLESYLHQLTAEGIAHDVGQAEEAYQAGLVARVIRTFSSRDSSEAAQMHATLLLQWLVGYSEHPRILDLAKKILTAWGVLTGLALEDRIEMLKTPERRRLSRAMAFHLRHDPDAPMTRDGWVHAEELATILQSSGHRVTPGQLLIIAGAMGEPRFEISGQDIRAVYGHSLKLSIDYAKATPPKYLFHGTATSNLASIVEARDGLRRMGRQQVHLTTVTSTAVHAALRRQESTFVVRVSTRGLADLRRASESTWLVPRVPIDAIEVIPLWALDVDPQ